MLACLPKEIEGAWVIDSVATLPGKRQGYAHAQVNMYIGNEPALKLYRKLGFEIAEEQRDGYFEKVIGSPGMFSLRKELG